MYVCLSQTLLLFFVSRWNLAIFGHQFSMTKTTKRCSSISDLGHLKPKIYSPKLHKIAYMSASMADRPEMFAHTRGFSGMADSMEPCKMLWGRPLLPWQRNLHKIAYKSACMADRPEMFGHTGGFSGMADSMEPCKMLWGRPLLPWQRNLG